MKVHYLPKDPSIAPEADMPDHSGGTRWLRAGMFAVDLGLLRWRMRKGGSSRSPATA